MDGPIVAHTYICEIDLCNQFWAYMLECRSILPPLFEFLCHDVLNIVPFLLLFVFSVSEKIIFLLMLQGEWCVGHLLNLHHFFKVKVCCFISLYAWAPLDCHVMLVVLSVDSLIIRPVCIIGGWNHIVAPSPIPCCKLKYIPSLLFIFWIAWVATTSICFLLNLIRTLPPLLPSGLFLPLPSILLRP